MFAQLVDLHGDKAAWKLVDAHQGLVREIPFSIPYPDDINTPADFDRLTAAANMGPEN